MRSFFLASLTVLFLAGAAVAQQELAEEAVPAGEVPQGGLTAVFEAAAGCTAAMRYEASLSGEADDGAAADRLAQLTRETGEGLGELPDAVDAQLDNLTRIYAEAAAESPDRHRRMIGQCRLLAASTKGD